ncbi:MAG: DegV family protein [Oscillospiraceae bacterium]|nr:DegV family protein [Oscillospiraceae bacterium]
MNIKIMSDSTCDLSKELLEKHNISIVPLTVIKNDQAFSDGITITTDEIFAHVAAGGGLCTTAAIGVLEYQEKFAEFADKYDAVIHINISSELSSSYQNASLAAQEFDNVVTIDSRNLSTGQGLVVLKACELAQNATSVEEIKEKLIDFTGKIESSFLLDRLDYMVKGGRCTAVVALGANLLGLKPCIEVKDGKMGVVKKYRGNYAKSLASYVRDRLANRDDLDRTHLFVTHTPVSDECLHSVEAAVAEHADFENIYWTTAGCTISCHCGPGTLGVLFAKK